MHCGGNVAASVREVSNEVEVVRAWYDDGSAVALIDVDAAGPISGDKRWLRLMRA